MKGWASLALPDIGCETRDVNEVVGRIAAGSLERSFVQALLKALREGVPVRRLADETAFMRIEVAGRPDSDSLISALRGQIKEQQRIVDEATRQEAAAGVAADEPRRQRWDRLATQGAAELAKLEARLARAEAQTQAPPPSGPFDAYTSVLLPALKRIATCNGLVTQQEYRAFRTLLSSFRMWHQDNRWMASASIWLRTTEGVAELGPFVWEVPANTRGTHYLRAKVSPAATAAKMPLSELKEACRRANFPPIVASVLDASVFPELSYVVLHGHLRLRLPDWIDDEWRDRRFVRWVAAAYRRDDLLTRQPGLYARTGALRQAVAHYAAIHPQFTADQAASTLPVSTPLQIRTLSAPSLNSNHRPWQPTIVPIDVPRTGFKNTYAGVRCACGDVADIVTRTTEIPRDLLCSCLRMPDEELHGMPPGVRFPSAYRQLQLGPTECAHILEREFESRKAKLCGRDRQVLTQLHRLRVGATDPELTRATGIKQSVHQTLVRLESYGFLERTSGKPAVWSYTEEGEARAKRLIEAGVDE